MRRHTRTLIHVCIGSWSLHNIYYQTNDRIMSQITGGKVDEDIIENINLQSTFRTIQKSI